MNANNDEGKLNSRKEALIALANGEKVKYKEVSGTWRDASLLTVNTILNFDDGCLLFRLAPRTITLNGIKVPAPAEDKDYHHQGIWILNSLEPKEYGYVVLDITDELPRYWWKSEEEIKQVVAALCQVFGGAV